MRFILIIVLCSPLILSSANDDPSENEISNDETSEKDDENSTEIDENNNENENPENMENLSLEEIYKDSVQAYLDEDWDGCISGFTKAVQRYKDYKNAVIKCREDCREIATGTQPIFPENIDDLHFYEKKVHETFCLLSCNQNYRDLYGSQFLNRPPKDIAKKFADDAAYEYLQICYYQRNHFQDAANAVYTYLVKNPKHEMSRTNLRYYISLPEVEENKITNLEAEPFLSLYKSGVNAYEDERYEEAINNLEKSLFMFIQSDKNCRFFCEGYFDQGWLPDFTASVANHFAYCLKCKSACATRLSNVNGEYHPDLLPSHYHYLQFAYYKTGDVKSACSAVGSYLLFYPSDDTMLNNAKYYSKLPKFEKDYLSPRKEAVNYVKRREYELRLLRSVTEDYKVIGPRLTLAAENAERENSERQLSDHPPPGHSPTYQLRLSSNETWKSDEKFKSEDFPIGDNQLKREIRLIANENDLGGELRYLAEGFLNETECKKLIKLAEIGAVEGDGYEGNASPHSNYERFEGLTLGRAALMVYFGLLEPEVLELALLSTEEARDHVERYFNLDRHLYFTYTHLACRTALPDSTTNRRDLSHAIHADNCIVAENGTCASEWPAYTFRDYSAIIYLNDNFDGGEFVFAGDSEARVIQSTISPRCGRMVAFSASGKNLHGVRGVLRGRRCALALWFTFDEDNVELERILARAIIRRVRIYGTSTLNDEESVNSTNYEETLSSRFETDEKLRMSLESLRGGDY